MSIAPPPNSTALARQSALTFWRNQQLRLGRRIGRFLDAGRTPPTYLFDALAGVQSLVVELEAAEA